MEMKANIQDYRKYQGADIVGDFVQALKFESFDGSFEISRFNPEHLGYLSLMDLSTAKAKVTVALDNRFDVLSDTVTLNGYEKVRRQQLEETCG